MCLASSVLNPNDITSAILFFLSHDGVSKDIMVCFVLSIPTYSAVTSSISFQWMPFFYLWQEGIDVVLRLKLIHLLLWFLSFPAIVVILVFLFLFCLAKPNICRLAYFVIVLSRFVVVPAVVWISIVLQLLLFLPFFYYFPCTMATFMNFFTFHEDRE